MSKLVYGTPSHIDIVDVIGDKNHGTFVKLECEKHGTQLCLTDVTGADWCLKCIETMLDTRGEIKPYDYDTKYDTPPLNQTKDEREQ